MPGTVVISLTAAAIAVLAGRAASVQPAKTVWDGAYTEEQAMRGEASYQDECASCHMADLRGEGFASALIADAFTQRWQNGSVGDLLTVVKVTMPQDSPSTLSDEAYADIVAYLLKTNGYPPGQQELSKEPANLKLITFKMPGLVTTASDRRLVEAVKSQDKETVRALLKQGADVNTPQPDGATALHWAAYWDDHDTADRLIGAGATVSAANDLGVTPLWLACNNGSPAMIERLLKAGADPNAALPEGETPLMTAARTGNVDGVKWLLAHGADVNASESRRGQTALMWAVAQHHLEVMQALIEHEADVHARSRVWPQFVNSSGNADISGAYEIARGGSTPLLFAVRHGDLDSARLLLGAGANVNDTGAAGTSALVVAAHSGHGALAARLLDQGADPNAADAGYTALLAAVLRGDLELVKALVAHGADPNASLRRGTPRSRVSADWGLPHQVVGATPFWLAASFREPSIMRVLAASGGDPLFAMEDGTTPLMAALKGGSTRGRSGIEVEDPEEETRLALEAVKLVVELGADVNAADQAGDTGLHMAAAGGLNAVVQFLADGGAKLDVKNKGGQTPLAMTDPRAASRRRENVDLKSTADLLRALGAKE